MKEFTNEDLIEFLGNSKLSRTDLRLLSLLCKDAINNVVFLNQTHLAVIHDLQQSNVSKSLKRLEKSGLIEKNDRVITIKFNIK